MSNAANSYLHHVLRSSQTLITPTWGVANSRIERSRNVENLTAVTVMYRQEIVDLLHAEDFHGRSKESLCIVSLMDVLFCS